MSKITLEMVSAIVDRHGYFSIGMKGGFHAAYIKVKHPKRQFLEGLRSALGFGQITTQRWQKGEVSWLIFEGPAGVKLAHNLKDIEMEYQGRRLALVLEFGYHVMRRKEKLTTGKGKDVRFSPRLTQEELEWREQMRKEVKGSPEPPEEVRNDYSWIEGIGTPL